MTEVEIWNIKQEREAYKMDPRVESAVKTLLEFLTERTRFEEMPDADIIFVLGQYDQRVAQQAAYLWHHGKARHIVVAGKGESSSVWNGTEADFYAAVMIGCGVPQEAILCERESGYLPENAQKGMETWRAAGIDPKTIIICAIPLLLRRSCAIVRKQCPDVIVHGSAYKPPMEEFSRGRLMRLVNEIGRLDEYAARGVIAPILIPSSIRSAAQTIRSYRIT